MIYINSGQISIQVYLDEEGHAPFTVWLRGMDGSTRARINARIARFQAGYFGDHKYLGRGVYEAKFSFGPGYRVYVSILKGELILLLVGGDKSTQQNDIRRAQGYLKAYLEVSHANKKS